MPVKIHVLTAIAAENKASAQWSRQGQCGSAKKKKNYTRGRGREYSPSSRVPQPRSQVPLPMTDNDEERMNFKTRHAK